METMIIIACTDISKISGYLNISLQTVMIGYNRYMKWIRELYENVSVKIISILYESYRLFNKTTIKTTFH